MTRILAWTLLLAVTLGALLIPSPVVAEVGGNVNWRFIKLSSFTRMDTYTDENWFGFSDADAKVTIVVTGCRMLGTAEALVEDGATATAAETAGPGRCKLRVTFKNCQAGSFARVNLRAKHTINYTAALPGGTVTSSVTFSGSTESLGVTTSFDVTLQTSGAPAAGSFKTTETTSGNLTAHGTRGSVELGGSVSTSTSRERSVAVGSALTDGKTISKTVEKQVDVVCDQTKEFPGRSNMTLAVASTETSDTFTDDFRTIAQAFIRNSMAVVGNATVFLKEEVKDTVTPTETALAGLPQLIPGRQSLLANPPQNLVDAHPSDVGQEWSVFVPDNQSSTPVDLTSSDPSVVQLSTSSLQLLSGDEFGAFDAIGAGAGMADIEASIPSLAFQTSAPVDVQEFQQLTDEVIFPTGEAKVRLVEGTSKPVVLNRQPFNDMKSTSTSVQVTAAAPSVVSVSGDPTFGFGETTSVFTVTGVNAGVTNVTVLQPDTEQQFGFTVNVIQEAAVVIDGGSDFVVQPEKVLPLALLLSDDLPSDLKVTIHSSDPGVVSVAQSSVVFPTGSKLAGFSLISGEGGGQTTISITTPIGTSDQFVVTVKAAAVGGIVDEIPDSDALPLEAPGSSGPGAGVLAGGIAGAVMAGAVALGGAAWYVRRRLG